MRSNGRTAEASPSHQLRRFLRFLQVLAALVVLALLSWFAALWSCAWCYERYRKADAEKEGGSPSAIWHPRRAPAFFSKRRGAYEVL